MVRSQVLEDVHRRIAGWTRELFGPAATPLPGDAGYRVHFGSAFVDVSVTAWGDKEAVVTARAPVVSGAAVDGDLMRHLLRKNCETRFGAFGVRDDGEVEFRYALVGSTCQKEELRASVQYVMLTADLSDDEIVRRWGGLRARDRV